MQTVAAARAWAIKKFKHRQVISPALTADLLLGFVLGWDRVRVLSHTEQYVQEEAWNRFRKLVRRRALGEPLQYLTGEQEFYGRPFRVTHDVLIPRPETEILVDRAVHLMMNHPHSRIRFVDVGTGSGCIAVSVACEICSALGWAIDNSAAALSVAVENAYRNGVAARIQYAQADLLECFPEKSCFDFVLSNPPYVAREEYANLPVSIRDHEPRDALWGGESGLEIYRRLIPEISPRLQPGGYVLLELGAGQAEQVGEFLQEGGLSVKMVVNDLQEIPRCLVGQKPRG
jgi:release factor glutamine methyltransferase